MSHDVEIMVVNTVTSLKNKTENGGKTQKVAPKNG